MANLRDRLKIIHEQKKNEPSRKDESSFVVQPPSSGVSVLTENGWENCGFQAMKREVITDTPFELMKELPQALAILVPDLSMRNLPDIEDFVFFDLETTGLSGGAGTIAFLAAFGKQLSGGKLSITQYLLLDYPGEDDFLEAVLQEFKNKESVIVTYNGKCFDSQILKTRCLMNRKRPPEYFHADLLHPARRLWKNVINDCSQGSVETRILGIERENDIPGALAPEIWFEFLKTGETGRLTGICDHNCADIAGLSSILSAMISIASDPFCCKKYLFDLERLALYWRGFLRRSVSINDRQREKLRITGDELLKYAAEKNYSRAALVYAQDNMRMGDYEKGRNGLIKVSESDFPLNIRVQALRSLAIDSERRLKSPQEALEFVKRALDLVQRGAFLQSEFERRKERLEKNCGKIPVLPV